jgi:hypothetical protein
MSLALDKIKENFENIVVALAEYEDKLSPIKADLKVAGKPIDKANIEQASLQYLYNECYVELKAILNYVESIVDSTKGRLWKNLTDDNNRMLQQKDKEHYINHDPEYLAMRELYIEIEELTSKYAAAVKAFESRGYVLNNLTRLIIKDLDSTT